MCIQKFPDWLPGVRTAMIQLSATRCSCIAILWVSLVSFAAITLCVASQRVFIVVVFSLSTESGNVWIYLRKFWTGIGQEAESLKDDDDGDDDGYEGREIKR
jgi:hypothetical protein